MLFIILALLFYTAATLFSAMASRAINSTVVAAIVNLMSALIPIAVVWQVVNKKFIENGKLGIIMAILGGICIAFFSMAINKSFQVNKVGIVSPLVFGGAIFLSTLLSAIFFREKITPLQFGGLAFLGLGFFMIYYAAATGK